MYVADLNSFIALPINWVFGRNQFGHQFRNSRPNDKIRRDVNRRQILFVDISGCQKSTHRLKIITIAANHGHLVSESERRGSNDTQNNGHVNDSAVSFSIVFAPICERGCFPTDRRMGWFDLFARNIPHHIRRNYTCHPNETVPLYERVLLSQKLASHYLRATNMCACLRRELSVPTFGVLLVHAAKRWAKKSS